MKGGNKKENENKERKRGNHRRKYLFTLAYCDTRERGGERKKGLGEKRRNKF